MAHTIDMETGKTTSTFNTNRGHKPGVNQAVGGIINDVWGVAKELAIPAAGIYAIYSSTKK